MRGRRESTIGFQIPDRIAIHGRVHRRVARAPVLLQILLRSAATNVLDMHKMLQLLSIYPVGIVDESAGVGEAHDLTAQIQNLLDRVLSYIARAGHQTGLALQSLVSCSEP